MKKLNLIFPVILISIIFTTSCKKEEDTPIPPPEPIAVVPTPAPTSFTANVIGTWSEAQHKIDGTTNSFDSETISFFSDGTYTTFGFTYPWHCEIGAKSNDSGNWTYNSTDSTLTINSTKLQEEWNDLTQSMINHANPQQIMKVETFSANEIKVQFLDVNCSQNVELTFQR